MPASGVYELLSTWTLAADHRDLSPRDPQIPKLCNENGLCSCFRLCSAYTSLTGSEPEFTTMAGVDLQMPEEAPFSGTLDYIWYSPETLEPVADSALCIPSAEFVLQSHLP